VTKAPSRLSRWLDAVGRSAGWATFVGAILPLFLVSASTILSIPDWLRIWLRPKLAVLSLCCIPIFGIIALGYSWLCASKDAKGEANRDDDFATRYVKSFRAGPMRGVLAFLTVVAMWTLAFQLAPRVPEMSSMDVVVLAVGLLVMVGGNLVATRPPRIEVGTDGVTLRQRLGTRFVPFERIARVELIGQSLALRLRDGGTVKAGVSGAQETSLIALCKRIERRFEEYRDDDTPNMGREPLRRAERSVAQWRSDLTSMMLDGRYRESSLSQDDLEAILVAPSTGAEERIGAAIALRAVDGDSAAPAIRIVADGCAQPEAREALLRIANEDYDHAAVLEALETEKKQVRDTRIK